MTDTSDSGDLIAAEVHAWVEANWTLHLSLSEWWQRLADSGFAFPSWPEGLGGRGMSSRDSATVARSLASAGVVGAPSGVGQSMGAPTVLRHGGDKQKNSLVPALASGAEAWCQLFSEPSAGSDLAGLRTAAELDGDEWVVTGQKVWNSGAQMADRGLLLARTDPTVPKHHGISYFVIDMRQPGIEARPLRQMNGEAGFCEVFLTEARVPADNMIGAAGDGWKIAQTTLAFERAGVSARAGSGTVAVPGRAAGMLDRTVGEVIEMASRTRRSIVSGFIVNNRALANLAREQSRTHDPIVRQGLARFKSMTEVNRLNGLRARSAAAGGQLPGGEASVGKLAISNIAKASRDLTFSLMGADGMLDGDDAPGEGAYHKVAIASFGAGFGGGTDEIQRNVIGERTLGLPREPSVDRDVPFDQIPAGPAADLTEANPKED